MWEPMNIERFASFERCNGASIIQTGSIWWKRVRPFFYRPLFPFERFDDQSIGRLPKWTVFQYSVPEYHSNFSYFNFVIFEPSNNYDPSILPNNARRNLKKAMLNGLTARPVLIDESFINQAFPVYQSFVKRTGYSYEKKRLDRTYFNQWMHAVSEYPEAMVLGIFDSNDKLVSFEISCLVNGVLFLKTMINSERAVELHAPDLGLHYCREQVKTRKDVRFLFDSYWAIKSGVNYFKLMRGASVMTLPTRFECPWPMLPLCKTMRSKFKLIKGMNESQINQIVEKMGLHGTV
jgi:hypothetical protein